MLLGSLANVLRSAEKLCVPSQKIRHSAEKLCVPSQKRLRSTKKLCVPLHCKNVCIPRETLRSIAKIIGGTQKFCEGK